MDHEQEFLKLLFALAKVTNFELEQEIVAIYDTRLAPLGYEKINLVLKDLIAEMPRVFPSVKAIYDRVVPEISIKDQSNHVVDRLMDVLKRHGISWDQGYWSQKGSYWLIYVGKEQRRLWSFKEVLDYTVGPVGIAVIQSRGGWRMLAEDALSSQYSTTFRAQLRESVISVMERAKLGKLDELPQLPGQKSSKMMDNLIESSIKTLE